MLYAMLCLCFIRCLYAHTRCAVGCAIKPHVAVRAIRRHWNGAARSQRQKRGSEGLVEISSSWAGMVSPSLPLLPLITYRGQNKRRRARQEAGGQGHLWLAHPGCVCRHQLSSDSQLARSPLSLLLLLETAAERRAVDPYHVARAVASTCVVAVRRSTKDIVVGEDGQEAAVPASGRRGSTARPNQPGAGESVVSSRTSSASLHQRRGSQYSAQTANLEVCQPAIHRSSALALQSGEAEFYTDQGDRRTAFFSKVRMAAFEEGTTAGRFSYGVEQDFRKCFFIFLWLVFFLNCRGINFNICL
jgi:hypothetical protein